MPCCTLRSQHIDFYYELTEPRTLFEIIQAKLKTNAVEEGFNKASRSLQGEFDEFRRSTREKTSCNAAITGFDPMNMVRIGDEILCRRFVMLDGEYIEGPVLLQMEAGALRQVEAYYR